MGEEVFCYLHLGAFGRWVIVNTQNSSLAWSGSQWVPHADGIPTGRVQISNFETREEAFLAAEEAGLPIALTGYSASYLEITCFACGMTSFNANDVREKYCGNCHMFHKPRPESI